MQRTVLALIAVSAILQFHPSVVSGQATAPPDLAEIQPVIPPGISDFNIEITGRLAYTWDSADGEHVTEVLGDFVAAMGGTKLSSKDAVIWFRNAKWQDKPYIDMEIFLWQDAEVIQPAGTRESGPALLVTLRTFGRLVLNSAAHAAQSDEDGELYKEARKARRLLEVAPPPAAESADSPVSVASKSAALARFAKPKPIKAINFTAQSLSSQVIDGQNVVIAQEDVFVSQGAASQSGEYVELRANSAVLYLKREQVGDAIPGLIGGESRKPARGSAASQPTEGGPPRVSGDTRDQTDAAALEAFVSAVYLEGDVVLARGDRMIRAPRLYYDFDADRALILDAVTRAVEPSRSLPIYVRAQEIRQLSATEYEANKAQFTTSEFHTPHVAIGADRIYLQDKTPRNEVGDVVGVQAGTYKAYHTTMNLEGIPIAYWPFAAGDFSADRQAFRSAKIGYNGDFGWTTETRWSLFNLMGLTAPVGFDATLKLDYFTDRGPAVGIDSDYQNDDYYGLLRTYYINDGGSDEIGPERSGPPDHENRGRATWRHRQFLPKDWELTLEASYISDDNFMEQYERNEWENGKDQETLAYLLKRQDNWQYSTLLNYRINEFLTQTEHMPDNVFSLIGEPLGDIATLYSESRVGLVRYRPDERRYFDGQNRDDNTGRTGTVVRGDTREELQFPMPDLGPMKLTPYLTGRVGGYDDGPSGDDPDNESGSIGRVFGAYGVRGNMLMSKSDDSIESEFFDLHRMRHVIKPDFTVWNAHGNRAPLEMTPFDSGVEDIDDFGGGALGLRQRLQTKRGGPGKWRTVDWIVFDVEAGFFNDAQKNEDTHGDYIMSRPEDSISSNFIATNMQYRISDSTVVVYDGVYDTNRGNMGNSNISLAVEREPRLAYFVGWRYIHDTNNSLVGGGFNYKLSEKHTVGLREFYDVEEGRNYSTELIYIRKWPRWYTAVALDVDKAIDDVGINFSIWPEGSPRMGLGSKRYTGMADSVGIRPR